MIALEITIDGKRICTAGVDDTGVVSAVMTWVRRESLQPGHPSAAGIEESLTRP